MKINKLTLDKGKKTSIQRRRAIFLTLAVIMFSFFLIGITSAWNWDNVKRYDEETKTIKVVNALGLGKDLATIKLDSPQINFVMRGKNRLVAEFTIENFEDYSDVFNKMEFYDVGKNMKKFNREFIYKYKNFYDVNISDFENVCEEREVYSEKNQTNYLEKYDCKQSQTGSHIEQRFKWNDFDEKENLLKGETTIGIFTDVLPGEYVEWIPTFYGIRIDEWAIWTESFNVGLVAYYTFNETSGTNLPDVVRGKHNGTASNSPAWVPGKIGNALRFERSLNHSVIISDHNDLDFGSNRLTLSYWINRTTIIGTALDKGYADNCIPYRSGNLDAVNENYGSFSSSFGWKYVTYNTFNTDQWYHIVTRWNGTDITLFKDGVQVGTVAFTDSIPPNTAPLKLGSYGSAEYLNGTLDEIGLWNRSLSDNEITNLYNSGNGMTYDSEPPTNPPSITLNIPADDTTQSSSLVTFNCSSTDDKGVFNVSLWINSQLNYTVTNSTPNQNLSIEINLDFTEGDYNWTCKAWDGKLEGTTETRVFGIDATDPVINITYPLNTTYVIDITTLNYTVVEDHPGSCWITSDLFCYQESATVSDQTGIDGDCNLNYSGSISHQDVGQSEKIVDGDWGTYSYIFTGDIAYTWINYTKPEGATSNSLWKVKGIAETKNISIPFDCFNQSILQFLIYYSTVPASYGYTKWYCYKGSGEWQQLDYQAIGDDTGSRAYEEAMWWNFGAEPISSGTNFTGLISFEGSNTWNVYCNDTAGNENSSSITFFKDAIAPMINITSPSNNTNSTDNNLDIDYIVSDINLDSCWYSNDTYSVNTTLNNCVNITAVTWSEGQHNITIWANDTLNNINSSSITFTIDTLAPSIIINEPRAIINYGYVDANVTLNWSITEINIDTIIYNYNGTNVTVYGAENKTNFAITNYSNRDLWIWVNDTFGNKNISSISWNYNVFENSQTYNSTTYETASEGFIINLTYDALYWDDVSAILYYNGTGYTGTEEGTGNTSLFTKTINIPEISSAQENRTFYWTIGLTNSTGTYYSNSTFNNQTVNQLQLGFCDDNLTTPTLNFTSWDEETLAKISSYNFYGTFEYWSGGGSITKNFSISNASIEEVALCINANETFYVNAHINYGKSGYVTRTHYLINESSTNLSQEVELILLNTSSSTSFILEIIDDTQIPVEDSYIHIQRYYPGTDQYRTVEMGFTDSSGSTLGHFKAETEDYRVIIEKGGLILYQSGSQKIFCKETPCTLTFQIDAGAGTTWDEFGIIDQFTWSLTFENSTKLWTYSYVDNSGSAGHGRLYVYYEEPDTGEVMICNESSTSIAATLTCDVTGYNGTIYAKVYLSRSPEILVYLKSILASALKPIFGLEGLFLSMFVLLLLGLIGLWNPAIGIISLVGGMIILNFIGIASFGVITIWGIIVIGLILLWGLKT